jgi:hypothetical protein
MLLLAGHRLQELACPHKGRIWRPLLSHQPQQGHSYWGWARAAILGPLIPKAFELPQQVGPSHTASPSCSLVAQTGPFQTQPQVGPGLVIQETTCTFVPQGATESEPAFETLKRHSEWAAASAACAE